MSEMGTTAFAKMQSSDKRATDPRKRRQAQCIVDALLAELPEQRKAHNWEVEVFVDEAVNAFALPGGKVGVNTGMWGVAQSQDQMAAVLAHEIAHVVSRHSAERVSQQMATGVALEAVGAYSGQKTSPENAKRMMSALGLGAQVAYLLPYSRIHETDADLLGQQYMARAGFNPQAAVSLWQQMAGNSSQKGVPELLSTHPNPESRIRALNTNVTKAKPLYEQAKRAGKKPNCY